MEIKEGQYVRTNQGRIRKIRFIKDNYIYCDIGVFIQDEILKASYNIIDLIEEGDYVNGYKIDKVCNTSELNPIGSVLYHQKENFDYEMILGSEIKSVVTHEQFDSMKYEVK